MTKKMIAPDAKVKQTDVGGYRYNVNKQGVYKVDNAEHIKLMKREGYIEASLTGATVDHSLGFTCGNCGFGSWFKKCSRCGTENEK